MNQQRAQAIAFSHGAESVLAGNRVIRNTSMLLSPLPESPNSSQTVMMAMGGTAAIFFEVPALSLTVSPAFVLLMSGLILYETNNIIHGGEANYVMATVSLFVSIFNLFTSLLHLLGFASSSAHCRRRAFDGPPALRDCFVGRTWWPILSGGRIDGLGWREAGGRTASLRRSPGLDDGRVGVGRIPGLSLA